MKRLLLSVLVIFGAAGCQESFTGEWLEQGVAGQAADAPSSTGGRREAMSFDGISTVRIGAYDEAGRVVDNQSVQDDLYFVFDGGKSAQFGSLIGRLDNGRMTVTSSAGKTQRIFVRSQGHSIFPPLVQLPQLTMSHHVTGSLPTATIWTPFVTQPHS